jgi:hypothetical protein
MWARDVQMISSGNMHALAVSPSAQMVEHEDSLIFHTVVGGGNAEGGNGTMMTESGNETDGGFSVDLTLHCTIDVIVPFVPAADSDAAPVALTAFNLTQSKGETRTPPTLVIGAAAAGGAFLRIGSLSVSFPDHATATVEAFHASIGSMVVEATSAASVQLEDVNIETSLRIEAEKVHGYLAASLRGSNYLRATEQVAATTTMPSCKRAGSVVSSGSGTESVFWLFPAVNQTSDGPLSGTPATINVKSSSLDSRFLVDVTEGQCGTYRQQTGVDPVVVASNNASATSSKDIFSAASAEETAAAILSHDLVSLNVRGFGATRGVFTFASSGAYSFFSAAYISAFSLSLLAPSMDMIDLNLHTDAFCAASNGWLSGSSVSVQQTRLHQVTRALHEHVFANSPDRIQVYHAPYSRPFEVTTQSHVPYAAHEIALVNNVLVVSDRLASVSVQLVLTMSCLSVALMTALG